MLLAMSILGNFVVLSSHDFPTKMNEWRYRLNHALSALADNNFSHDFAVTSNRAPWLGLGTLSN